MGGQEGQKETGLERQDTTATGYPHAVPVASEQEVHVPSWGQQ